MIQHVVAFNFEGMPEEHEKAMIAAMHALKDTIPELKYFTVGRNISPRDQTYTHCLVEVFDDMDAMQRYLVHPDHEAVVTNFVAPYMKQRMICDYEFDAT